MKCNKTTRLDAIISDMAYILDCLRLLRDIENTGDCNNCGKTKQCMHLPKVGGMVRYNCPFYKEKEGD